MATDMLILSYALKKINQNVEKSRKADWKIFVKSGS